MNTRTQQGKHVIDVTHMQQARKTREGNQSRFSKETPLFWSTLPVGAALTSLKQYSNLIFFHGYSLNANNSSQDLEATVPSVIPRSSPSAPTPHPLLLLGGLFSSLSKWPFSSVSFSRVPTNPFQSIVSHLGRLPVTESHGTWELPGNRQDNKYELKGCNGHVILVVYVLLAPTVPFCMFLWY